MKMIPASVALRQKGAHDFAGCYDNLCALQSTAPLASVKAHLENAILDVNGDRLRLIDWPPILNTLKLNKNLRYVAFRSYFQPQGNSGKKQHYFRRRVPAVRSKQVTLFIAKSVSACLSVSKAIKCIDLQGVPLREKDVKIIASGLAKNKSLTHVLFDYCQITDNGVHALCDVIRNHLSVTHVSMSGCNVTAKGAETISRLIRHQSMQRHSDAWADGLRQRTPNLDRMSGIRRITLNSNPMIGDKGAAMFAEALRDDLWVKALDLQHCGVTSAGADLFLSSIEHNRTVCVLDVRRNPMIDGATLRRLLGRVLLNVKESDEFEFPWVREQRPTDPYRTKRPRVGPRRSPSVRKPQEGNPRAFGAPRRGDNVSDDDDDVIIVNPVSSSVNRNGSSSLTSKSATRDGSYVKQLEIAVLDLKRRLSAATENEKKLNATIVNLEVENSKLRNELRESFANSRIKSQLDDDFLLDSVEKSFSKFHEFLNTLGDLGLGSLVAEAGLRDGAFSVPFSSGYQPGDGPNQKTPFSSDFQPNVNQKTPFSNGYQPDEDASQKTPFSRGDQPYKQKPYQTDDGDNHKLHSTKREKGEKGKIRREMEEKRGLNEENLPLNSAIVIEGGLEQSGKQKQSEDDLSSTKSVRSSKYDKSSKSSDAKVPKNDQNREVFVKSEINSSKSGENSDKSEVKSKRSDKIASKSEVISERIDSITEEICEEILSEIISSDDTF